VTRLVRLLRAHYPWFAVGLPLLALTTYAAIRH
jgi:hypothetical protein